MTVLVKILRYVVNIHSQCVYLLEYISLTLAQIVGLPGIAYSIAKGMQIIISLPIGSIRNVHLYGSSIIEVIYLRLDFINYLI